MYQVRMLNDLITESFMTGGKARVYPHSGFLGPRSGIPSLIDRKSTRLNSSHLGTSYAVFCLKKKTLDSKGLAPAQQLESAAQRVKSTRPRRIDVARAPITLGTDFTSSPRTSIIAPSLSVVRL